MAMRGVTLTKRPGKSTARKILQIFFGGESKSAMTS